MAGTSEDPKGVSPSGTHSGWSRRSFLRGVGVAAVSAETVLERVSHAAAAEADPLSPNNVVKGSVKVTLTINGQKREIDVEPRTTLLSAMRDRLDPPLTGPKLVCNAATCGACTVLLDDKQ